MAVTDTTPPPSRWTLRTIRATFDIFGDMTLSGVWRIPGGAVRHRPAVGGGATLQPRSRIRDQIRISHQMLE